MKPPARRARERIGMMVPLLRIRRLFLGASVLAVVSACERAQTAATLQPPAIGASAPVYTAMDLTGAPTTLASLKGQVVILNVWATWCRPCLEEIPLLESTHRQFAAQGVATVGVSIDAAGMGADVQDFMRDHNMSYQVWLDPDRNFSVKFLTVGVPETFILDRRGVIRWRTMGAIRPGDSTFVAAIRDALAAS